MDRRQMLQTGLTALTGAVAGGGATVAASVTNGGGQARPSGSSKPLGVHPLGPEFAGWQGTMLEVTYAPGQVSASHQHPGPTFGYVLSGKIRWAINGETPQVLEAGQTFFEPMGAVHSTSANASATEPARISVVILGKAGDALSKPAAKPGGER